MRATAQISEGEFTAAKSASAEYLLCGQKKTSSPSAIMMCRAGREIIHAKKGKREYTASCGA